MNHENISLADVLGPWIDPDWQSGLIERCRNIWSKPLPELTNEELATVLRQRFAVEYLLPIAQQRVRERFDDETELFDGELESAVEHASKASYQGGAGNWPPPL